MFLCITIPVLLVILRLPGPLPPLADLSGNGVVDLHDFQEFANWYGGIVIPPPPPPARLRADLNNDGRIDLQDHAILKTQLCGPDECCHCEHDPDCYDDDVCKFDACVDGCCEHIDIPGCCRIDPDCDDYDFCTIACFLNECLIEPLRACCFLNEECDDHTPCTMDTCEDFTCQFTHIPDCCGDDSDCDDGVACTRDECVDGTCVYVPDDLLCNPGAIERYNDPDADCVWKLCVPGHADADGGGCAPLGLENVGSSCDDGGSCSTGDVCQYYHSIFDRFCESVYDDSLCNSAPRDNDPDPDCLWYFCRPRDADADVHGCVLGPDWQGEFAGSPCDDQDVCTAGDHCLTSTNGTEFCWGSSINCDDGDPCTASHCDPQTGCWYEPICGHHPLCPCP